MTSITLTSSFLNSLLDIPHQVSKKLPEVLHFLDSNPRNQYARKIVGYDNIWRIYVTRKYRLFYKYDNSWIKLIKLIKREKDTYRNLDFDEREIPTFLSIEDDEEIIEGEDAHQRKLLTEIQLRRWLIPQEYWSELLALENDERLLDLAIPQVFLERIIDNLYSKPLNEIQNQFDFDLKNFQALNDFIDGKITNFLLKLSPEQEKILNRQSDVPTLIKGGPGTGKSTLALYRVKQLVDSGIRKILFTTHTESLVNYSKELLEALLQQPLEQLKVEVCTVDNVVQKYYKNQNEPLNLASREISLLCLESVLRTVQLDRDSKSKLEKLGKFYLLEEILDVIEARGILTLEQYQDIERFGRRYRLDRRLRKTVWEVYQQWQTQVNRSGYVTIETVRRQALEIVTQQTDKPYEAVIIDEAQDLSPVALKFLVGLARSQEGIYLTADTSQSLYQRSFSWNLIQATIQFQGHTHTLRRSFRNTEQIGKACPDILANATDRDVETIIREFSPLEGEKPKIILTDNLLDQMQALKTFFGNAANKWHLPVHAGAVLVPNAELGQLVSCQLNSSGLKAEWLPQGLTFKQNCIKVLSLRAAKGLEFPFVAIVGLEDGLLPIATSHLPNNEREELLAQERRLFYVGCSRAMRSLLVCGSLSKPSPFLTQLRANRYWQMEEMSCR
jgi:superfamily I DNA/RNA helicase/mRNA-degrading endonuclease RelE of RelBE toxin-antitoxin system